MSPFSQGHFLFDRSEVEVRIPGEEKTYFAKIQGRGWKFLNYPKDQLLQPNNNVQALFVKKKKIVVLPGDLNIRLR